MFSISCHLTSTSLQKCFVSISFATVKIEYSHSLHTAVVTRILDHFLLACILSHSTDPNYFIISLIFQWLYSSTMDSLRQYFWLLLGIAIVIADSAMGLTLYLMFRIIFKANQRDGENYCEGHITLSCFTSAPLSRTSQVHTRKNTYQLDNERNYENAVSKSDTQDNASHDYEQPPDFEPTTSQDYINVEPENEDNYDDVVVPDSLNGDYENVESVPAF
ncbi:uncharacterized protein [Hemitrygon akajei]|uniref:uncharacterized protein isoform X1 n=1 Tax=Hemitrygon akajei TaxID=2704970 RepID=UPI003BF94900